MTKIGQNLRYLTFCFVAALLHWLFFFFGYFGKSSLAARSLLLVALENACWYYAFVASPHKLLERFLLISFDLRQSLIIGILLVLGGICVAKAQHDFSVMFIIFGNCCRYFFKRTLSTSLM